MNQACTYAITGGCGRSTCYFFYAIMSEFFAAGNANDRMQQRMGDWIRGCCRKIFSFILQFI